MQKWEELAQQALLERDIGKSLEIFEEAKTEAIRAGVMEGDNDG